MHSTSLSEFQHTSFHGRIGIDRADITPSVGIYVRNWGSAKHDVAHSIHRSLTLTALTLTPLDRGSLEMTIETMNRAISNVLSN